MIATVWTPKAKLIDRINMQITKKERLYLIHLLIKISQMPHRQTNHMSRRNKQTRKLSLTKKIQELQELKGREITNRMLTPKLNRQVSDYRVDRMKKEN